MARAHTRDGMEMLVVSDSDCQMIHVRIPRDWNRRLTDYAHRHGMSRNLAMVRLTEQVMDAEEAR